MRYLITGHTGFKGAWLVALLTELGHEVSGISLDPDPNSIYEKSLLSNHLKKDLRIDIRDKTKFREALNAIQPEVVIHLAAQSQVLLSYEIPTETFETNVNGTLNLLGALSELKNLKATLIVTTDKVYKNNNSLHRYREEDPLQGKDPYSSSKAMADLLSQSWMVSFPGSPIGIARAGNVIGGGDHSPDRLIPSIMEKILKNENPIIRNPGSIRPWQHVLDCLNGYLMLISELIETKQSGIWNFGPSQEVCRKVEEVTEKVVSYANPSLSWKLSSEKKKPEELLLLINSQKAREELGWSEKYSFEQSVEKTVDWYLRPPQQDLTEYLFEEVRSYLAI